MFHSIEEVRNHFENFNKDEEIHQIWNPFKELTIDDLDRVLSLTVKHDKPNKIITFFNCLNSQTDDDQFTITNMGGSSEGKTWVALEVADYFPEEKQIVISNASPTAFYHEHGLLVSEATDEFGHIHYRPIQPVIDDLFDHMEEIKQSDKITDKQKKELNQIKQEIAELKASAVRLVDLEGKIIIFLDQANPRLMENLRSLISHDRKFIQISITNRSARGSNYTEHIVLVGYPAMIFCTAYQKMNEQEITRTIQISPDTDQDKLNETLRLIVEKKSNEEAWYRKLDSDVSRQSLMFRIELIQALGVKQFNSERFKDQVLEKFLKTRKMLQPRHQRDLPRIYNLIHAHALMNVFTRTVDMDSSRKLEIEQVDIDEGFRIYEPIAEANEHYVSPEIWALYKEIIIPCYNAKPLYVSGSENEPISKKIGVSRSEIKQAYREQKGRPLSDWALTNQIIPSLLDAGLVIDEKNPEDQRERLFTPIENISTYTPDSIPSDKKSDKNEIESTVYVPELFLNVVVKASGTFVQCRMHHDATQYFQLVKQWNEHIKTYHLDALKNLPETALEVFKRLSGESKQVVESKAFYEEMEKIGRFSREQIEKVLQDMWKSGVIYEVKAGFFKKVT
ncbi:MAG: hypothetical protein M1587_00090 [Thaumarchaeota archaeon]|nr:hypothetical protein [Nitrososphaerota archaeon]MCL5068569.1 hypothetical protein [Nitrososphaerota archaeon]